MEFDNGDVRQHVLPKVNDTTGGLVPPHAVLIPLLALARTRIPGRLVASCEFSDDGTVWRIVAIVEDTFITVDASSPVENWTLGNPDTGDQLRDGEKLDARVRRLADVASVQFVDTAYLDTFGGWRANGRWRLNLTDGSAVDVQASHRIGSARQACDDLALHVIDAMN